MRNLYPSLVVSCNTVVNSILNVYRQALHCRTHGLSYCTTIIIHYLHECTMDILGSLDTVDINCRSLYIWLYILYGSLIKSVLVVLKKRALKLITRRALRATVTKHFMIIITVKQDSTVCQQSSRAALYANCQAGQHCMLTVKQGSTVCQQSSRAALYASSPAGQHRMPIVQQGSTVCQ